jgi:hypothetical protein
MSMKLPSIRYSSFAAAAVLLAAFIFFALAPGCDTENPATPKPNVKPSASLVEHSGCKVGPITAGTAAGAAFQDCAAYELMAGDTLILTHSNAAFNCCPGDITAEISFSNDTIRIVERESELGCHCLCLYDLTYRVANLEAGTYTILFVEPYMTDADQPLRFTANLASNPTGAFCIDRIGYPWNEGGSTEPYGRLVSRTDCHSHSVATAAGGEYETPGDMSCVDWQYSVADGVLSLKHINAAFNCCPGQITAGISISNDTITIVEREEQSMCDCSCLYDLEFEIRNLPPGSCTIRFVEPYVQPGDERLDFTVDLANLPAGMTCVYRGHYPWMYESTMHDDAAKLDAMRKAIVALIGTPACGGEGDCRYIGLGVKPCGGVWEYLIYSASTVDTVKLEYLVMLYNAFDDGFNHRYNVASDCMFVTPPTVRCFEGVCEKVGTGR